MATSTSAEFRVGWGVRAALIGVVIGNLGRVPVLSTGGRSAPVLVNDLLVMALVVLGALVVARSRAVRVDGVARAGLAFIAVAIAGLVSSMIQYDLGGMALVVSLGYLARWVVYFALYLVAINTLRAGDVRPAWRALELAVLGFAIFGIFQSIFLPGFAQMVYPSSREYLDWDPQGHRLVSTFLDPNFAGAFLLMGLLPQLARIAQGACVPWWQPLVLLAALLMTASRSSLLALAVGGMVILAASGLSRKLLQLGAIAALLLAAALPRLIEFARAYNKLGFDPSAMARLVEWARGLRVFLDNPVIGIGFNTWGFVQERYGWIRLHAASYSLDGGLIFVAVLTGAVGLAWFVAMQWRVCRAARAIWRTRALDADSRGLALGTAAVTVAMVVHSLFTNSLLLPLLMEPMFVLWALVAVMKRELPAAHAMAGAGATARPRLVALPRSSALSASPTMPAITAAR